MCITMVQHVSSARTTALLVQTHPHAQHAQLDFIQVDPVARSVTHPVLLVLVRWSALAALHNTPSHREDVLTAPRTV